MSIRLSNLKEIYKEEKREIHRSIDAVLKSGNLILSKENLSLEQKIAKLTKQKFCLTLNSGTDALMMSLWASGVKKNDEVITTPLSFIATVNSIIHIGAKPVFVDVGDDLNINPDLIEKSITKKTKAILPVHWAGRVCNMDLICKIAKKYNLIVIEDAAQAMGAYYKNKHAGNFGKISAFSLHPYKNLSGLGDGGFIVTNQKNLYDKIKIYRNHGLHGYNNIEFSGVNSRLDALHAAVVNLRLKKLNSNINYKRRNVSLYKKLITTKDVKIIEEKKYERNAYSVFIILCKNRDKLQKYLKKYNIETGIYYRTPLHLYKATKYLGYKKKDLPNIDNLSNKFLSLPIHKNLKLKDIKYVCNKINRFYKA
jgi:dTDP-4-amino-4,6-dideoxygalactose transaminase